jgi:serine protease Do
MTARFLAVAIALATAASPAYAQISNSRLLATFQPVVAKANESTVRVRADDKDIALGTVVFADGFILTKASEVRGGTISVRFSDGSEHEAKIHATHVPTDLALLKVDVKGLKPVTFAESKNMSVGSWLAAAGPQSSALAVGIVSHKVRQLRAELTYDETRIENFSRGFLGIYPEDEKDDDGKVIGAKIATIEPKGGAAKAGLKEKDVIVELNGTPTLGQETLRAYLENLRPGDSVKMKVLREGKEMEFKATLTGQLKPSRGDIQNSMGGELSGRRTGFGSVMQTDMVLAPKDCGGPVVDLDGKVLGVNIARAGRVETWILPSEVIKPLLPDLKAGKSTAAPKK